MVCFQWHKLSLDKVYDSIIVRGWQVLLPVAFNASIELYPLPPLTVSLSLSSCLPCLPCALFLSLSAYYYCLWFWFLSQLLLSLSLGRGNLLLLLSLSTSNHPSVYPSTNQATNQATKQPSIQLPICSISAPLCVGVGVLESCILTGQRQVCCWIILLYIPKEVKAEGKGGAVFVININIQKINECCERLSNLLIQLKARFQICQYAFVAIRIYLWILYE